MILQPSPLPCINPSQILTLPAPTEAGSSSAYILSIDKLSATQLLLTHGNSTLTVVDTQTLKVVDTWTAPEGQGHIVDVAVDEGEGGLVWTCGKEGAVRGWDSRVKGGKTSSSSKGKGKGGMRGTSETIHQPELVNDGQGAMMRTCELARLTCWAHLRVLYPVAPVQGNKVTPLLSLASAPKHHLIAAGTELTNHEATIVYWYVPAFPALSSRSAACCSPPVGPNADCMLPACFSFVGTTDLRLSHCTCTRPCTLTTSPRSRSSRPRSITSPSRCPRPRPEGRRPAHKRRRTRLRSSSAGRRTG